MRGGAGMRAGVKGTEGLTAEGSGRASRPSEGKRRGLRGCRRSGPPGDLDTFLRLIPVPPWLAPSSVSCGSSATRGRKPPPPPPLRRPAGAGGVRRAGRSAGDRAVARRTGACSPPPRGWPPRPSCGSAWREPHPSGLWAGLHRRAVASRLADPCRADRLGAHRPGG